MNNAVSLSEQIDAILTLHHAPLLKTLPVLSEKLMRFPKASDLFEILKQILMDHLMKEEKILFPNIIALEQDGLVLECGVVGPITQMLHEHQIISSLVQKLRCLSDQVGDVEADLITFLDDLGVHSAKEDEELFPGAIRLSQ